MRILQPFLGKYKPRRVNITLYGTEEKTYENLCHYPGGFGKTLNGIRLLRKYGVDVKVGGSLTKANRMIWTGCLISEKSWEFP